MPRLLPIADQPGGLKPVHAVHLHVQQDDGKVMGEQPPQGVFTRRGLHQVVTEVCEHRFQRQQVGGLIVDQQDVHQLAGGMLRGGGLLLHGRLVDGVNANLHEPLF